MNDGRHSLKLTIAFVALWAAEEALTGLLLGHMGLGQIVWIRFLMHLAILWTLFGWKDAPSLWRTRRPWFQLARASMMVGMPAFWVMGVQRGLSPSTMMSVFWLAPLFILGFARVFLKERTSGKVWLASLLACAGVFAVTGPHPLPRWILLVFPLGMAVCFSLYMVMTRALRDEPTRTNLFYTGLGVCLLLAPLMPYTWVAPTRSDVMILAGVALLGLGALFALERVTARSPFSYSAPLVYLQIPFALGIAWSLEQYDPSLRTLVGLLITFGVVFYVWMRRPQPAPALSPDTGLGGL